MRRTRHLGVLFVVAVSLAGAGGRVACACDPSVELLITEFMALNTKTLADDDGDYSDWIEIHNPCVPDVDLDGWYLTDDAANLTKWRFPSVHLSRGEFLVVFASGKNRTVPGSTLHANFKLAVGGEYLALVKPDGTTVAQAFSPQFPPQTADVSCGLPQSVSNLVGRGDSASYHVPESGDAPVGAGWTAVEFDDAGWPVGPTGLGFSSASAAGFDVACYKATTQVGDLGTAEAVIVDPALQSSVHVESAPVINYLNTGSSAHFASDRPFPGTTIGVNVDDIVVEARATIAIPSAGFWTFGVNSDDGFSLELSRQPYAFSSSHPSPRAPADTLTVFDIPEPGSYAVRLVFFERGGGAEVELFAAQGSFTSFSSAFRLVGDGANGGLRFSEIASLVGTDVGAEMRDVNASLWSRVRFAVANPSALDLLLLRMAYEDGFVAYLNGVEVASRNAPAAVHWDSASTADRPIEEAGVSERIDLSTSIALLQEGPNVFSVHGLNDTAADPDFVVLPELDAAEETSEAGPPRFFADATPGSWNSGGYAGVSGSPVFSHPSGFFVDPFSLVLTTAAPGAAIRFTLDGSEPSETRGTVYTGPLAIADSTRIRARVFEPDLAPGPVVTRMYGELGTDVVGVNSNLPLVVLDTFGGGINQEWLAETLAGVIPTAEGRASMTAAPQFVGPVGIRYRGSSSLGFPKKSYFLETWDEDRQDLDVGLLGMPPESDWILYGPYTDKTLMRDVLAYKWSNDIGRYAVRTRFVEMYLRTSMGPVSAGDYVGVYVLMEKIKRDPSRVAITELLPEDAGAPAVTGGYITKKDRLDPGDTGFLTNRGQRLCYVEPKEEEITAAQAGYLKGFYDEFEAALYGAAYTDPDLGYAEYIDVDAWIDHHWLVEMTKNIDGFRLSTFMFKDRENKLAMGPIWDYNLILGNANYLNGWLATGWYHDLLSDADYPWWRRLFEDPEFGMRYQDRWYALRRGAFRTEKILADIDAQAALLAEAQVRNFARWRILGVYVWPNWFIGQTYEDEVDWMRQWAEARLAWIDAQFFAPPSCSLPAGALPKWSELVLSAPAGVIYYTLDGSDPRLVGGGLSPSAIAYSGPLVLIETVRVNARVFDGTRWSALYDAAYDVRPLSYVNEVLPDNATVRSDEQGEFDPWIELYDPFLGTVDLGGLFLSDDPAVPLKWPIPAPTPVCGGQWLLVWADGETAEGPLHASFTLNPAGGQVLLSDGLGRAVDSLTYPALGRNVSFGRAPDGSAALSPFLYATPESANGGVSTRILVNEYNAVSPDKYLASSGTDSYWGRIIGNGGDWFELVVVEDHLDLRGWSVVVADGTGPTTTTLVFSGNPVLSDLRSGTILTVAENLASNASYDPANGDWWLQFRSGNSGDGLYVSAIDFSVSNQNTQLTMRDAGGAIAFGPAGEGIKPPSGIGSDEVFKLEADPGPSITAFSNYNDGTSSTFGAPNRWSGGTIVQDFTALRSTVSRTCATGADCSDANPCTDDVCAGEICVNPPNAAACDDGNPCTTADACANRQCRGTPLAACCFSDCDCDDGLSCTVDTCTSNACAHGPAPVGTPCDDGAYCTVADACAAGTCAGTPRDCDDGDACTDDACEEIDCRNLPNGICSIAGIVRYYRDGAAHREPSGKPVPHVPIDKTLDAVADAATDGAGAYAFGSLFGAVTVSALDKWGAPRASDHNGAITSFDAAAVARHAVGLDAMTTNQRIAGDVSGNGEITSYDAAKVAQFAVELIDHFEVAAANGSDWRLFRCDHYADGLHHDCTDPRFEHATLGGAVTDDFYAVLYGDATGSWEAGAGFAARPGIPEERAAAEEDRKEAERLRAGRVSVSGFPAPSTGAILTLSGWNRSLPPGAPQDLLLSVAGGDGIEAFDFVIAYDPSRVTIGDVRTAGVGFPFRLARHDASGTTRIGMYSAVPIRGGGPLLSMVVRVTGPAGMEPPIRFEARANEGRIPLSFRVSP